MERSIRNSAKALIFKEGRVLAVKIKEKDEEWYIMPNAVCRKDHNQTGCDWLDIHTLNHTKLYPSKLRRQIMNLYEGKPYKVYLGNEEAGDPECFA